MLDFMRILVIDDEPLIVRSLTRLLRKHDVVGAANGAEALARLEGDTAFDGIFCDVRMPDADGVELAGEINTQMPRHVVNAVASILAQDAKDLDGSSVLVLGVAYKKNVGDVRETPAAPIVEDLQERGAQVQYHDPLVPNFPKMRRHDLGLHSVPLTEQVVRDADVVLIVTDHDAIDFSLVATAAQRVVDTRNVLSEAQVQGVYRRA